MAAATVTGKPERQTLSVEIVMPQATTVVMDSEKSKLAAHAIKKRFEELNTPIKLNHAYEALAIAHRHPNWATMKASLEPTSQTATSKGAFVLGHRVDKEADQQDIELSHEDALRHIHCFATSAHSRRDILERLGKNAIRQGSSAIYIEPVSDEESRSAMLNALMSRATQSGRRRDFFVLDLSAGSSRVGNTCDILDGEDDASACANLFLSDHYRPIVGDWLDAHRFLSECARRILERGFPLDPEGLALELRKLETDEIRKEWRKLYGENYPARTMGLGAYLANHVERFAEKHRRFFDRNSAWPGLSSVFVRPQILIVFVSTSPGDLETKLQMLAFKAIRKALNASSRKSLPGMLLLNDVDLLGKECDVADLATSSRVCIVLADQCPTLPVQFDDAAVEFRSVYHKEDKASAHYLVEDGVDHLVWGGPRARWQGIPNPDTAKV
jgi:hypothetical protein